VSAMTNNNLCAPNIKQHSMSLLRFSHMYTYEHELTDFNHGDDTGIYDDGGGHYQS
jgi:hypothetical protein